MMISTKGRYALRVMIDLAEHNGDGYIAMKTVAKRQDISLKYLEKILPSLVADGLVEGVHGKGGGYKLSKDPSEITAAEIIKNAENGIAPVACLEDGATPCEKADRCKTLPMWKGLSKVVDDYLAGITLDTLIGGDGGSGPFF